jgi:NADPH oxidase 2
MNKELDDPCKLPTKKRRMLKYLKYYLTLLPECILFLIWIGIQCFLFTMTFTDFKENPSFKSTNALTGSGVALAKACASVINFNAAVLVGSMCKIGLSWIKRIPVINFIFPIDQYLQLHRISSVSIILFSLIHTIAHYVNYTKIPTAWLSLAFLTGPGATGHFLWLFLLLITTTSFIKKIKTWKYEVFWYFHYLAFTFLLVLSFHGAFCFVKRDSSPECPGAKTWKWLIGPVSLFTLELLIKTIRSWRFTFISKVIIHQADVVEVQIKKPSFIFKPGQYLQLKCPEVSLVQWHPFTITSAPEEGFISLHIRVVGDWTKKFSVRLGVKFDEKTGKLANYEAPEQLPDILIDGPYGSVSENYDQFEVAICIGAGIGQTPFSSILKSMWYSLTHPYTSLKLKKVLFIQISREIQV